MFYDKFKQLCDAKEISVNKACVEIGLSRSVAAKWKSTKAGTPTAETCKKIADYFGVPVDVVLGNEEIDPLQILKDEEKALLHSFRTMTDEQKRMMSVFIKGLKND